MAGIRFASITARHAYLLYPARWFPVSGYTTDRFMMELKVSVAPGFKVIASGLESPASDGTTFRTTAPGFAGSLAVVEGAAQRVSAEGVTTDIWFGPERQAQAPAYGEMTAKVMTFLTSLYGLPPQRNLTLVESGAEAPGGYSAPGILFLSPAGIGDRSTQRPDELKCVSRHPA